MKFNIKLSALILSVSVIAACSGPMVHVDLRSDESLNPDRKGDPLPVVVRVYQLNDKGAFESATFNQLWKNDEAILGGTLLTRNELILNPASKDKVELDRHEQAKYVGVVAVFRNPVDRKWRAMRELRDDIVTKKLSLSSSFDVSLIGNSLHITD
jgi:type VI secretion system protein VasD